MIVCARDRFQIQLRAGAQIDYWSLILQAWKPTINSYPYAIKLSEIFELFIKKLQSDKNRAEQDRFSIPAHRN